MQDSGEFDILIEENRARERTRGSAAAGRTKEGCTVKKLIAALAAVALLACVFAGIFAVRNHGLRIHTEDLADRADQLDGRLAAASGDLDTARAALAEALLSNSDLETQLGAVSAERDAARADQEEQAQRSAELEALNGELTAQADALTTQAAAEKADLEASAAQLAAERDDYRSQAEAARQALSSLTEEWNKARADLIAAAAQNEALNRQRGQLQEQLTAAQAEITALTTRANSQAEAISALNALMDQHAADMTDKENQIAALNAYREQAKTEQTEKENEIAELTAAQEQAQTELGEKEAKIAELTASLEQAQAERMEKENQMAEMTAAQQQLKAENAEKDRQISALTAAARAAGISKEAGMAWVVVRSCDENGVTIAPEATLSLEEGVHRVYPQDHPALAGYVPAGSPYQEVTVEKGVAVPGVITFLYCPAAAQTEPNLGWGTVISDGGRVNLRSGPGTGYSRLALLPVGTNAEILGMITNDEGQWYYVAWNGLRGYILGTFLTVNRD